MVLASITKLKIQPAEQVQLAVSAFLATLLEVRRILTVVASLHKALIGESIWGKVGLSSSIGFTFCLLRNKC